jgi:hypothetical protein
MILGLQENLALTPFKPKPEKGARKGGPANRKKQPAFTSFEQLIN